MEALKPHHHQSGNICLSLREFIGYENVVPE
jgi:hypothetical protein